MKLRAGDEFHSLTIKRKDLGRCTHASLNAWREAWNGCCCWQSYQAIQVPRRQLPTSTARKPVKPLVSRMIKRFISFTGIRLLLCGHAARHRTRNSIKLHRVTHPRLGTLVSIIRKLEAGQRQG